MDARRALLYVATMAVLVGGGIEVAVRLLRLAPPLPRQYVQYVSDPVLPHRPGPNTHISGRSEFDEFDFDLQHNSLGFRDDEPVTPKPKGVVRILGLGDSFTYGIGAPFDSTYLAIAEARLNGRPGGQSEVDVVKMGVPRFFTEPERLVLELYGPTLQPDIVVVGFLPNDVADADAGLDATSVSPQGWLVSSPAADVVARFGALPMMLYSHSHTARVIMQRVITRSAGRAGAGVWEDVFRTGGSMERAWRDVEAELDSIASISKSLGAELVVLNLPQTPPWRPEHTYPGERLSAWAEAAGAHFLDILPIMAAHDDPASLYWPHDGHCTPAGYALIGSALADFLVDRNLLP